MLHGFTFGSIGFVENLSFFSPISSKRWIIRSDVQIANFKLFGAHAIAAIFAIPSYTIKINKITQLHFKSI